MVIFIGENFGSQGSSAVFEYYGHCPLGMKKCQPENNF